MSVQYALAPAGPVRAWLPGWAAVGLPLLFGVACTYGVLEVHYSNDTWIGLAAGRQILTEPWFPIKDTFSYTFYGAKWFNQNWLSHVFFWLLYDKLGRNAVVAGTWAVGMATFALVLLAIKLRSGSWPASFLAASMVAIACRDWLSIRPATIQFFFLAADWLCLSALISQGERRRWWAVLALVPIYGLWTHVHGSFLLGFGLLGVFLACAVGARIFRRRAAINGRQAVALVVIGIVTAVMGAVASPYGLENYTHPFVVVESELFRQVGEWLPPFHDLDRFPPVGRFWVAFAIAAASPLLALVLRLVDPDRTQSRAPDQARASSTSSFGLHMILFDVAAVLIGLRFAFFARRFAPVLYILAAPALVMWTLRIAGPLAERMRVRTREALIVGSWVAAAWMTYNTIAMAYQNLVKEIPPNSGLDLLDRVTHNEATPFDALKFLQRNALTPNVLTEWKVAGYIMFAVPGARVFIDGRAQQVYSEQHYVSYMSLLGAPENMSDSVTALLDQCGTDAILLPRWPALRKLTTCVTRDPRWVKVLAVPDAGLWIRQGSALFQDIERRERAGQLWWPDYPEAELQRGVLWVNMSTPDLEHALTLWRATIAREPSQGVPGYDWMAQVFAVEGRFADAYAYFDQERAKLAEAHNDLPDKTRAGLLEEIQRCVELLRERAAGHAPSGG